MRAPPHYATYVMPLGKHKGQTLAQIERAGHRDYIVWAAREVSDRHVREAAASYLAATEAGDIAAMSLALPLQVAASTKLSPGSKLLFAAIYTAADQDPERQCHLSNEDLQAQTGLSAKHVKRLLAEIEMMGLIHRSVARARRTHIRPTWHPGWSDGTTEGTIPPPAEGPTCPPWEGPDEVSELLANREKSIRLREPAGRRADDKTTAVERSLRAIRERGAVDVRTSGDTDDDG